MGFNWNEPKKVEMFDTNTKQTYLSKATPKYILNNPHGFRQDDIIHSLCIVASEIMAMAEAEGAAAENIQNTLSQEKKEEPVEEKQEGTVLTAEDI